MALDRKWEKHVVELRLELQITLSNHFLIRNIIFLEKKSWKNLSVPVRKVDFFLNFAIKLIDGEKTR